MKNISTWTPFVRYALIALSATLVNRGLLTPGDARAFATDPAIIELTVGAITAAGTLIWYLTSRSRAAIKQAMDR